MEQLARYRHHPDPGCDFCIECEVIEGLAYDVSVGMADQADLDKRLIGIRDFRVGGDPISVAAKASMREQFPAAFR